MGLGFRKTKKTANARQPRLLPGQDDYSFRRSRTITGTTSSSVAASAESRSQLKTPRLKVHELHQQRTRVMRVLMFLGIAIAVLAFLVVNYTGSLPMAYPQAGADAAKRTVAYQQTLLDYYGRYPLQRFGFLLDNRQLEAFVRAEHSEIAGFTMHRLWYGAQAASTVYFRKPLLVWETARQRFYIDDQGVAFDYDHFGQPLVAVRDESGISADAGSSVASQRFIRFLGQLTGAVNGGGRGEVEAIVIPPSTREIDLRLKGRGYPIKTHIDRDPLQQAQDVVSALRFFDEHKITPQYVDVRVAGRAFYK